MVSGRAFSQAWGSYRNHQEEERLSHRPPLLVATMSLRPAIPQRVARQQSPPPLHRLTAILKSGGEVCQSRMKLKKNPLDTASRFQRWLHRSRARSFPSWSRWGPGGGRASYTSLKSWSRNLPSRLVRELCDSLECSASSAGSRSDRKST